MTPLEGGDRECLLRQGQGVRAKYGTRSTLSCKSYEVKLDPEGEMEKGLFLSHLSREQGTEVSRQIGWELPFRSVIKMGGYEDMEQLTPRFAHSIFASVP